MKDIQQVKTDIATLKREWTPRNQKFKDWYQILTLVDVLATRGMESYVSNEPQTFYNMAHYLLTRGELSHTVPITTESALELDRRAKVHRACSYMWKAIDRERILGGNQAFIDELAFHLLVLGWYSVVLAFDRETGHLRVQAWSPADTFPSYSNGILSSCVHSYKVPQGEAVAKAQANNWSYKPRGTGEVLLDDYFYQDASGLHNIVLLDSNSVTGDIIRPEMELLVAPVGGFPDRGSLTPGSGNWKRLMGRSIFEVNEAVFLATNKWKSMISQILRDTAQPLVQEFSAVPQATPEQIRDRGGLFHYSPGEQGLQRLPPGVIPIEIQAHLLELRREAQKGSFSDAVFGMLEGQPGYSLNILASSSANQILYPYMEAKHFVIGESDRFWLSNLKASKRVFEVRGQFMEKLKPTDIPEDVTIIVESDVATPKDWLERGTVANMLEKHLDKDTIITEVLKFSDSQGIKRRKSLDRMFDHPISQLVEMIAGYQIHADYLERRGDLRQAALFRKAATALESQLGAPAPGQGKAPEMGRVLAEREAGAPGEVSRVRPEISPPEGREGFTPMELRKLIGQGRLRRA